MLLLASAYLGLSTQKIPQYGQSDKGLHFITFFLLTVRTWSVSLDERSYSVSISMPHPNSRIL